jgi:hypothetical protein
VAREAHCCGFGGVLARRDQRVEPSEQPVALRPSRRIGEPLRRKEGRDRQSRRVAQREVREGRQARLEPVDDVEAPELEREREVRTGTDRDADPAAPRDRDGGAQRDDLRVEAVEQRASACRELLRAIR